MAATVEQVSHNDGVEALYREYHRPVVKYLNRMISDHDTAEDLAQDTFVKALRNWNGRDPHASVTSWIFRIATNTAYDHLRRRRRVNFMPLLDDDHTESPLTAPVEMRYDEQEPVRSALALLPEQYRTPLVLHSCEGRSTEEIASALGCSNSAVKTRLFRARAQFRAAYGEIEN